jgi:hypothetical protein
MDVRPKRSIIWDEIGDRLGRGRKIVKNRPEINIPNGATPEQKRIALERAKMLVVHRHFAELQKIFQNEVEFLVELYKWAGVTGDLGAEEIRLLTETYYEAKGIKRPDVLTVKLDPVTITTDGAIADPMIDTEGHELFHGRPRPRRRTS